MSGKRSCENKWERWERIRWGTVREKTEERTSSLVQLVSAKFHRKQRNKMIFTLTKYSFPYLHQLISTDRHRKGKWNPYIWRILDIKQTHTSKPHKFKMINFLFASNLQQYDDGSRDIHTYTQKTHSDKKPCFLESMSTTQILIEIISKQHVHKT